MNEDKKNIFLKTTNLIERTDFKLIKYKNLHVISQTTSNLDNNYNLNDSQENKNDLQNSISKSIYNEMPLEKEKITNDASFRTGRWTKEEHIDFIKAIFKHGNNWKRVQNCILTRNSTQARSHAQKYFLRLSKILNLNIVNNSSLEYINKLPREFLLNSIRSCSHNYISLIKDEIDRLLKVLIDFNSKSKTRNSIKRNKEKKYEFQNKNFHDNISKYYLSKKKYFIIEKKIKSFIQENNIDSSNVIEKQKMKNDAKPINEFYTDNFNFQFNINNYQNIMSETTECNNNLVKDNIDNDLLKSKMYREKNNSKIFNAYRIRLKKGFKTLSRANHSDLFDLNSNSKIHFDQENNKLKSHYVCDEIRKIYDDQPSIPNKCSYSTFCTSSNGKNSKTLFEEFSESKIQNHNMNSKLNDKNTTILSKLQNELDCSLKLKMRNIEANLVNNYSLIETENLNIIENDNVSNCKSFKGYNFQPLSNNLNVSYYYYDVQENFILDEVFLNDNISNL